MYASQINFGYKYEPIFAQVQYWLHHALIKYNLHMQFFDKMHYFTLPLLLAAATLGPLAALARSGNPTEPTSTLPQSYYLQFILANSLQLGESCSWNDEAFRQAGMRQMRKFPKDSKESDQVFDSIVSNTVEKRRTFCVLKEMLVCDKNTATCVCGEVDVQVSWDEF